jgi:SAM-dependent methyltransferase
MQKEYYNDGVADMEILSHNHADHDRNPDYWDILLADANGDNSKKIAFDFGIGHGRNVRNLLKKSFSRVDGCDISGENIKYAIKNLEKECPNTSFWVYENSGVDLQPAADNFYDFVMSTIVLQHICVFEIREALLKEIYRIMKQGAIFSFQMGYDNSPHPGYTVGYYENFYEAEETNGKKDVCIFNSDEVINDLKGIGFKNINYVIRPPWIDGHHRWIYVRAIK